MEKDSLGLKRSCKKTLTDRVLDFFFFFLLSKMLRRSHETLKVQVFQPGSEIGGCGILGGMGAG